MSVFTDLRKALFDNKNNNYKAYTPDGQMIVGCGECENNTAMQGIIPFMPPVHKCCVLSDESGSFRTIFDPFDVLDECPLALDKKRTD